MTLISDDQKIIDGWEMAGGVTRLGTTGIFTAIIMAIIAVKKFTRLCQEKYLHQNADTVPLVFQVHLLH